jgi:Fur family transcriptional regulator, iron response regulator
MLSYGKAEAKSRASLVPGDPTYVARLLKSVGLRPTRQRVALGRLLFGGEHRHLTAEMLFEAAISAKIDVSLATVYNTLNQFTEVALLRQVGVDGTKTYFDTNVSEHSHFYFEQSHELVDIAGPLVVATPELPVPAGYEVSRIDVVVRLRRKPA